MRVGFPAAACSGVIVTAVKSRWGLGLLVRLSGAVALALVLMLGLVSRAGAVTPGANGLLLIGAAQGMRFSAAGAQVPSARVAECTPVPPDALWTVRPDGRDVDSVGSGSGGQFSPGGRTLLVENHLPCSDSESLSLSFAPFRVERLIRGAVGLGDADASPGSWLGPERPSVFDDSGRYLDALTGQPLLPGAGYSQANGGALPQASCDGRVAVYGPVAVPTASLAIETPVRSGRSVVAAKHPIVALHTLGDLVDAQWSSDGRYLFYVLHRERAKLSSLWRVDSDGAGRRLLYTDRFSSDLSVNVSPNGRWVLLEVLVGANEELWVIGSDGHGLHPIAVAATGSDLTTTAEWSPRGDRLFVIEDRTSVGPPPDGLLGPAVQVSVVIRPDGHARHVVAYLIRPTRTTASCGRPTSAT
jgi:hypothetical protein